MRAIRPRPAWRIARYGVVRCTLLAVDGRMRCALVVNPPERTPRQPDLFAWARPPAKVRREFVFDAGEAALLAFHRRFPGRQPKIVR